MCSIVPHIITTKTHGRNQIHFEPTVHSHEI